MYTAIVAALSRKVSAFVAELRKLVTEAETEAKSIEDKAKAEYTRVRSALIAKITAL